MLGAQLRNQLFGDADIVLMAAAGDAVLAIDDECRRAHHAIGFDEFARLLHQSGGFRRVHGGHKAGLVGALADMEGGQFIGTGIAGEIALAMDGAEQGAMAGGDDAGFLCGKVSAGKHIARVEGGRHMHIVDIIAKALAPAIGDWLEHRAVGAAVAEYFSDFNFVLVAGKGLAMGNDLVIDTGLCGFLCPGIAGNQRRQCLR